MTTWFTSDTHFWHQHILKYSSRPFATIEEMNAEIIRRWNSVVGKGDLVYHLGDFGFCDRGRVEDILSQLNGQKHLCPGNHDKDQVLKAKGWASVQHYRELKMPNAETGENQKVVLLHYAMSVWNKSHYGAIQLFGHSHGTHPINSQQLDVGVDCWDYTPVNIDQIRARLKLQVPYREKDRHADRRDVPETPEE